MRRVSIVRLIYALALLCGAGWAQSFPSSISSLAVRYEADCITFAGSVCGTPSNGATISTWADESGNTDTATVAGGTCTFNTSQINGKPAVTFSSNCYLTLGTGINGYTSGITMFVVMQRTGNAAANYTIISGVATNSITWKSQGAGFQEQCVDQTTTSSLDCGAAASDLFWHQMDYSLNASCSSTSSFMRIDQTAQASGGACGGTLTETVIGRNGGSLSDYFVGSVAALIVYNRLLSLTDAETVENYLYCKYALGTGPCSTGNMHHKSSVF